jgi:hypothetical protein
MQENQQVVFMSDGGENVRRVQEYLHPPHPRLGALYPGSKQVREIIAAVAQSQLVAFQFYRVLGVTFLVLYAAGQLPGIFALPAGWGDVMVGLTALMGGARAARSENDQLVTLWNLVGYK